jgi:hypothetical protein
VKGSTSYQFAKFFFPNIASGAGSCRLKIIPGKEDLLALVYKYDILGYKLFSNFIGSVDVGGGNFDVT